MKKGHLSEYFQSIVAKILRPVEVDGTKSHQHEFNGTKEVKKVIPTKDDTEFPCRFLWMNDEEEGIIADAAVSWYNSRKEKKDRSPEYRLYFPDNEVMRHAKAGDVMFLARRADNTLMIIICPVDSTSARQIYWLFNLTPPHGDLFSYTTLDTEDKQIDFSARFIIEALGIEVEEPESDLLDRLVAKYDGVFPSVAEFSALARKSLPVEISIQEDPDHALLELMVWEEKLFRRLERLNVAARLKEGFLQKNEPDVEAFISYSLSVQNRRKARAGSAFEEHVQYIFRHLGIRYSKGQITEEKARPDFLFPHIDFYRDKHFPEEQLTMLGAKTSLKDRWRQVLAEAARINPKHLLTMQPGISEYQTNQMKAHCLQLVVPAGIHKTYTIGQQKWIMSFHEFIRIVKEKQHLVESGYNIPERD